MNPTIETELLYKLCNRYQWFTAGSVKQYNKLFAMAQAGAPLVDIALVIWICSSDEWDICTIRDKLQEAIDEKERQGGNHART